MVILFFSLLPFGLCFLAFLPLCTKCKWAKDANHIDPVSNNLIGRFQRGTVDAPQMIKYHRYPPPVQRGTIMMYVIMHCSIAHRTTNLTASSGTNGSYTTVNSIWKKAS